MNRFRDWFYKKVEGAFRTGQSRSTDKLGHKTQNVDKQTIFFLYCCSVSQCHCWNSDYWYNIICFVTNHYIFSEYLTCYILYVDFFLEVEIFTYLANTMMIFQLSIFPFEMYSITRLHAESCIPLRTLGICQHLKSVWLWSCETLKIIISIRY